MAETVLNFLLSLPVADILLVVATLLAAGYCLILSRRLQRFANLENGMGGAIAVLSAQIDDLTKMLDRAEISARSSAEQLQALTDRSESGAAKLELLLASLHDLPDRQASQGEEPVPTFVRSRKEPLILEAAE